MHKTSELPSDWKLANIMLIYQKRDHNSPANYRPILLISTRCKVLEHIATVTFHHIML